MHKMCGRTVNLQIKRGYQKVSRQRTNVSTTEMIEIQVILIDWKIRIV